MVSDPDSGAPRRAAPFALPLYAATTATLFGASSAPTPLYRPYQEAWGFSSAMLTLVFAIYAFSLLIALLTTGSLSDHIGRRPVILGSLALELVAMVLFVEADGVGMLLVARVVQGFATGTATSALGAAILDVDRAKGPLFNSIAPLLGMGVGALGTSLLVEYAPYPLHLVYILLVVLFLVQAGATLVQPETVGRRPGAWAALRPRVRIPRAARGPMLRVAPMNIAVWALGGFFLSLGPTLARAVTGVPAVTTGGWLVFTLTGSAVVAMLALPAMSTTRLLLVGTAALSAGLGITLAGVHAENAVLFFVGTAIAGTGFGVGFQGAFRSILPKAEAHERAGLMAAYYVVSYLAFSLPAILAGTMAHAIGLRPTTDAYGGTLVVLAAATGVASLLEARRDRRTGAESIL